ncbi:MAG TPA: S8 family serine peptidase [Longimicrobium sp.]|nr:S8 family serine peptidase [Longimicrobium sp.]
MKPTRLFGALALSLAVAAPLSAQTAPPPAPAPADATMAGSEPPANWWQLDPATEAFRGIGADRAYRELLAGKEPRREVVVAIIDTGVEIDHPDLDGVLWTNPREVAGNGRDDDNNGYVDDVHGWDFIGGRDGTDVHADTYESVRIYAGCLARNDTGAECTRIATAFREDSAEVAQTLTQIRQIAQVSEAVDAILRTHLGTPDYTEAKVRAISLARPEVVQAKEMYLQMLQAGITPALVRDELASYENRAKYGMNPRFDSRTVVGDDPNNPNERGYGNAEVEGPFAQHGTHVAGIVAAERDGAGVDGVATGARIMVLRVVPDGDERDKDVANAIRYAADNGAQIINMSFGKADSPQKKWVDDAVRYADSKGVLMVHAAGNEGASIDTDPSYPTRDYVGGGGPRLWLEVGASSWDGLAADFSNYSKTRVELFAPGVSILSTVPNAGYGRLDGTSMAAPVVSGVAALLMAYFPELSAADVKQILLDSATRFPAEQVVRPGTEGERVAFGELSATGGVVNAYNAVKLAQERAARGGR